MNDSSNQQVITKSNNYILSSEHLYTLYQTSNVSDYKYLLQAIIGRLALRKR